LNTLTFITMCKIIFTTETQTKANNFQFFTKIASLCERMYIIQMRIISRPQPFFSFASCTRLAKMSSSSFASATTMDDANDTLECLRMGVAEQSRT